MEGEQGEQDRVYLRRQFSRRGYYDCAYVVLFGRFIQSEQSFNRGYEESERLAAACHCLATLRLVSTAPA